jgi:iron complex transport system substrate-binding protein
VHLLTPPPTGRRRWLRRAAQLAAAALATRLPAVSAQAGAGPRAQRIVSVGGALTETLYALGAQDSVVGTDTTSLFPAAALQLPKVGYARSLSAEGLLSLRPTLVVATADAGPPTVLRQVQAAGVQLALLDSDHRFEGVLERTRALAALCGREAAGGALVAELQAQWQRSGQRVRALQEARWQGQPAAAGAGVPLRVLFLLSHSLAQLRVAGTQTAADAMIRFAGAVNVMDATEGYKPLTPESAIAAAPDVILVTDQGLRAAGSVDALLALPGLAQTPAGRQRRVVSQDALLLLGFGPRLPQAVAALAQALYAPGSPSGALEPARAGEPGAAGRPSGAGGGSG